MVYKALHKLSYPNVLFADVVQYLATLYQPLNRKKILIGSIVLLVYGLVVFSWTFTSAPLALSPAGSIALALLFLVGPSFWPAIFLGSLIGMTLMDASLLSIFVCAIGHTLPAIVGAHVLRSLHFDLHLTRFRDSIILASVLVSTALIFPSISLGMELLFGSPAPSLNDQLIAGLTWGDLWASTIFNNLIVTPFILRWSIVPRGRTVKELTETVLLLGFVITISLFLFWGDTQTFAGISLLYFLLIPFFWSSIRLGPRVTIAALSLSGGIGISAFLYNAFLQGFDIAKAGELFQIELFFSMFALMFIILMSIEEERKGKTKELEAYVTGLRTEIKELSDDDRLKNEFIATLAHELRNPLAPIVSSLEFLRMREELSRDARLLVNKIQHQTETVKRLLDDLLDVSRITQKKFKLRKERSSLQRLISHCENNVEHILKTHSHSLQVDLPKDDVSLLVDPTRFEQIVTNLLYNAAKYTEPGGRIELRSSVENEKLVIRLKDNGIGIDPKNLEEIFLPFRQAKNAHHTGTGLGIGLAITKQLVEMHGGSITAFSEGLDKGSEFTVTLPILDESTEKRHGAPAQETKPTQRTILVVDDNLDAAQALSRLLEFRGNKVYVANNGLEAVENARLFKPEVILLDIGLPDIDGYEVARRLRGNNFHGKIIAVTGYGQDDDKLNGEEAGFDHHLVKPVGLLEVEKLL